MLSELVFLDHAGEILIELSGCVTVASICDAYDIVAAGLAQGKSMALDVDAVTEADLTFVQLIESVRRKASGSGCPLRLRRPATGAVLEVLQRGGFLDESDPDRARFWLEGAAQ